MHPKPDSAAQSINRIVAAIASRLLKEVDGNSDFIGGFANDGGYDSPFGEQTYGDPHEPEPLPDFIAADMEGWEPIPPGQTLAQAFADVKRRMGF